MSVLHRAIRAITLAVIVAEMIGGCQTTMNGVTLKNEALQNTKKIVVVSLTGDTLSYNHQGFTQVTRHTVDIKSLGLDQIFEERFAQSIAATLNVNTSVYAGPHREELKTVYDDDALLLANRFNWKGIETVLKAIKEEEHADLIAMVLHDGFQDPLANFQFLVRGLGVSSGRRECAAFAHITLLIVDGSRLEPIAGSNLYAVDRSGHIIHSAKIIPVKYCSKVLNNLSIDEMEYLKEKYLSLVNDTTIQQTVMRLRER